MCKSSCVYSNKKGYLRSVKDVGFDRGAASWFRPGRPPGGPPPGPLVKPDWPGGGPPGRGGQICTGPKAGIFPEKSRSALPGPPRGGRGPPPGGGPQEAVGGVLGSWLRRPGKIQLGRLRSLPVTSFRGRKKKQTRQNKKCKYIKKEKGYFESGRMLVLVAAQPAGSGPADPPRGAPPRPFSKA